MSNNIWDSPISIGNIVVKNRIVYPPISGNWANSDGTASKKTIKYYTELSEGGSGMIIVEGTSISPEGKGSSNSLCLYNKKHLKGLKQIADIIKKNNCFASLQLAHAGGEANPNFTGYWPVSPSGLTCKATGFSSRKLSLREIKEIRNKFINSAMSAYNAGFQAVELHLAHGYLLHEFISDYTNKRNDLYGGSLENKMRIIIEIMEGIQKEIPRPIIGVRISGNDYIEKGVDYEVNKNVIPILEKKGAKYFSVSAGIYETSNLKHKAMKKGEFFKYAKEIKEIANHPVIGVGKILNLESAERHLKDKDCDMVAMGRSQIADPYLIKKIKEHQDFNKCTECNQCMYLKYSKKNVSCPFRDF